MVTDQYPTLAHPADGQVVRCGYCPKQVVFQPSVYGGHALCFDTDTMPVRADRERTGWMPGMFPIDGTLRAVWAPWQYHGHVARRRTQVVHQLHVCSGQTRGVAA